MKEIGTYLCGAETICRALQPAACSAQSCSDHAQCEYSCRIGPDLGVHGFVERILAHQTRAALLNIQSAPAAACQNAGATA